jgi:hypothetical protein
MDYISSKFKRDFPEHFKPKITYPSDVTFYQYQPLDKEYLNTLHSNSLYISSAAKFNDPFDCWAVLDNSALFSKDLDKLKMFVEGLNRVLVSFKYSFEEMHTLITSNPMGAELLFKDFEKAINKALKNFGIACFTKLWDNELMWSHYATKHQGICVGYNFKNWKQDANFQMGPINYKLKLPIHINELFNHDLSQFSMGAARELLFTKSPDWHYEREWRLFTKESNIGEKIPLHQLGIEIKEIIFGLMISPEKAQLEKQNFITNGVKCEFYKIDVEANAAKLRKVRI